MAMGECRVCAFWRSEADRLHRAILQAVQRGVCSDDLEGLHDSYLVAVEAMNEHQILGHEEPSAVKRVRTIGDA